jgi:hypothetical protein
MSPVLVTREGCATSPSNSVVVREKVEQKGKSREKETPSGVGERQTQKLSEGG